MQLNWIYLKRFLNRVLIRSKDKCWLWLGCPCSNGYGMFKVRGRTLSAHRIAWSIDAGREVPEGMEVRHSCDNPLCVNPCHLVLGSHADNMKDMVCRRRSVCRGGEANPNSKLTEAKVRKMKRELAAGSSRSKAAKQYGIHLSQVDRIVNGHAWAWV